PPAARATLALHDALPICTGLCQGTGGFLTGPCENVRRRSLTRTGHLGGHAVIPHHRVGGVVFLHHFLDQGGVTADGEGQLPLETDRKSTRLNSSHVSISY